MNLWLDDAIYRLQANGGISRLWRELTPRLKAALPEVTWDKGRKPDLCLSTYYTRAPIGTKSLVLVYDLIQFKYPALQADPVKADIRAAIEDASAILAISQETADDVKRFFGREARVAYCGGGERFQRASVAKQVAFQEANHLRKPFVLMVGKRGWYKNGRSLFQAWEHFTAGAMHDMVCIGGEPPLQSEMDSSLYRSGQLHYLRELSDSSLSAAYSGATVLVYPSLYEGFGLPQLEAMSCGCPVVCGSNGALGEVADGASFTCEPLIPRSLASALDAACQPDNRLQHILDGYEQAKRFRWENMAAIVANEIRKIA